ncbi:MAG: hypothetical protein EBU82_07060, partial [Flavobacteriia bacterium]|nr:hypothetical protein [Flavobacteriia bacterium]
MTQGKMSLSQLTITKSLSAKYKPDYIRSDIEELEQKIKQQEKEIERIKKSGVWIDQDADVDDDGNVWYGDMTVNQKKLIKAKETIKQHKQTIKTLQERLEVKRDELIRFTYPAHKILADRIAKRDPGNAPASGERIGFVYIAPPPGQLAPKLQGDRIETPDFIRLRNLRPDYQYYI